MSGPKPASTRFRRHASMRGIVQFFPPVAVFLGLERDFGRSTGYCAEMGCAGGFSKCISSRAGLLAGSKRRAVSPSARAADTSPRL